MRDLKYHSKWDLFPLEKLYRGKSVRAFIQLGPMVDSTHTKKSSDDMWFWHKKYQTLIRLQDEFIPRERANVFQ